MFPVAYFLMTHKDKTSYKFIFERLKSFFPSAKPKIFMHDFELAAITAFRDIFPLTNIHGCFHHFSRAIQKSVTEKICETETKNSISLKQHISLLKSLSFVKPEDVLKYYDVIINQQFYHDHQELMADFFTYFHGNFIGYENKQARFPIEIWNCHDLVKQGM